MSIDASPELVPVPGGRPEDRRLACAGAPPPLRTLQAGEEMVADEWQGATIQTSFWRLYQADAPGVSLRWAGGTMAYPTRGLICIPGWLRFSFHWRRRVLHRYVHFEPTGWTRGQVEACFPEPFLLPDAVLGGELRRATAALAAPGACLPQLHLALHGIAARGLAVALARLDDGTRRRLLPAGHGRFAGVQALVEASLHRPLAVAELARAAGLRPQPFIRAFRRLCGTTPAQYVIERRVARACRLLHESDAPLQEIAVACGFPGRHYLTRRFARAMGVGPAGYRRRLRGS